MVFGWAVRGSYRIRMKSWQLEPKLGFQESEEWVIWIPSSHPDSFCSHGPIPRANMKSMRNRSVEKSIYTRRRLMVAPRKVVGPRSVRTGVEWIIRIQLAWQCTHWFTTFLSDRGRLSACHKSRVTYACAFADTAWSTIWAHMEDMAHFEQSAFDTSPTIHLLPDTLFEADTISRQLMLLKYKSEPSNNKVCRAT